MRAEAPGQTSGWALGGRRPRSALRAPRSAQNPKPAPRARHRNAPQCAKGPFQLMSPSPRTEAESASGPAAHGSRVSGLRGAAAVLQPAPHPRVSAFIDP